MSAEQRKSRGGITVTGGGRAAAAVDQVTVTLGVEILRPDPGEAFTTAGATVTQVLSVLADNGVDARSVRTADLSLVPRIEWLDNRETLLGYQAAQRLIVHLEALGEVERILTDVVRRGGLGVRIHQVALEAGDTEDATRAARAAAFTDAAAAAQQFAELAGRTLGAVQEVSEGAEVHPVYRAAGGRAAASPRAKSMPVATGDTEVNVTVRVRWAFAD
ncbi:MAG: SIMPL domain-containing protein [Nakamurella sp.]